MVLIIDAEMPHSCFDCPCLYREVDGRYFCRHSDGLLYPLYYPMTEGCPILGEIPDSHGDLIDRDKASTQIIAEICQFCASAENGNCDGCLVQKCLEAIGRVPTIVEATE